MELLRSADVVLLGERHWSRHDADLRNALVSDPEFASVSGTVLVEFGNSLYQDILDRYLIGLDSVPDAELYRVWRNTTTTSGAWDSPHYEEFYPRFEGSTRRVPGKGDPAYAAELERRRSLKPRLAGSYN